jgi:hypothetical protein
MADEPERLDGQLAAGEDLRPVAECVAEIVAGWRPIRVERQRRQQDVLLRDDDSAAAERRDRNLFNDEWGVIGECSAIEQCLIETGDGIKHQPGPILFPNVYSIKKETEKFSIAPGKTATLTVKLSEVRQQNDHFILTFRDPTQDPIVEINVSDDLEKDFDFGRSLGPDEKVEISQQFGHYRLNGMYFPGYYMKVRWWPKGWSASSNA